MKRYISIFCAMGLLLGLATAAVAGMAPGSQIQGSLHDLSSSPGGLGPTLGLPAETRICIYCHTPHHAANAANAADAANGIGTTIKYYPLWNHDVTLATYNTYTSGYEVPNDLASQLNAVQTGPGGVSRLCLSCHDGSISLNSYGNMAGGVTPASSKGTAGSGGVQIPAGYMVGAVTAGVGDLSNHHPVGFNYAAVQALDDEINDPANPLLNSSRGLSINDVLWYGNVECVSCHDVHNTKNDGSKFLWVNDNNQSDLCRSCHLK